MLRKHSGPTAIVVWTVALVLGWSPTAQADQAFHTTKYPLSSLADGSVHGWVTDIHAEGPTIYAQERYLLRHVSPGETYVMNLFAYSDTGCTDLVVSVPAIDTITTNVAGNARGSATFVPAAVEGLPRTTYHLRWQVTDSSGAVVYQTECVAVALD
jgi:hypothetical protein